MPNQSSFVQGATNNKNYPEEEHDTMSGEYDPRAVANLLLDEADRLGIKITNLALQKLLYFAHADDRH
ncbi:hypothetical protein LP421_15955 [Rhizobium sp. RCAM05350]|nr:hypothetical protein LP421_15955 [Rhizobium sp. RCAM05350]